jgi:hypothetical protein
MPDQRIRPLLAGRPSDAYQCDEPPDLGPLRALAEPAELAAQRPGLPTAPAGL